MILLVGMVVLMCIVAWATNRSSMPGMNRAAMPSVTMIQVTAPTPTATPWPWFGLATAVNGQEAEARLPRMAWEYIRHHCGGSSDGRWILAWTEVGTRRYITATLQGDVGNIRETHARSNEGWIAGGWTIPVVLYLRPDIYARLQTDEPYIEVEYRFEGMDKCR